MRGGGAGPFSRGRSDPNEQHEGGAVRGHTRGTAGG